MRSYAIQGLLPQFEGAAGGFMLVADDLRSSIHGAEVVQARSRSLLR